MNRQNYCRIKTTAHGFLQGFTLVEVLVSILILALGILGTIAMQVHALNDNQDAYLRTQAIFLAYDISDRMRANAAGWTGGVPMPFDFGCNQPGANCLPAEMAQHDYEYWQTAVSTNLVNGVGDVQLRGALCSDAVAEGMRVQITWQRANTDVNDRLGRACFSLDVLL